MSVFAFLVVELLIIAAVGGLLLAYGYHRMYPDPPAAPAPRVPEQRRPTGDDLLLAAIAEARADFPQDLAEDLADLHATVYVADIDWSTR